MIYQFIAIVMFGMFIVGRTEIIWHPFGDHLYYLNRSQDSNDCDARAACAAQDAYLARVDSRDEFDFIVDLVAPEGPSNTPQIRVDITHTPGGGGDSYDWRTITGHPALEWNTERELWHPSAPNNDPLVRLCGRFMMGTKYYLLEDDFCDGLKGYVCEKSADDTRNLSLLVRPVSAPAASLVVRRSLQAPVTSPLQCVAGCLASRLPHTAAFHPGASLCHCLGDGACDGGSALEEGEGWHFYKL